MANEDTSPTLPATLESRKLALDERRLGIEEARVDLERRALQSADEKAFELEQRAAVAIAKSPFLPENVGKDQTGRTSAAFGILRYARMLGADPFVVAQNIYVVHGRVGFSSAFLIAVVNARANLQRPIDWTVSGTGSSLSVTCTATDSAGNVRSVTMDMAQVAAWGWASKSDPWKADPALMLRYRTAAKLIRLYLGGAVMGLTMTAEELRDETPRTVTVGAPAMRQLAATLGVEEPADREVERETVAAGEGA